MNKLLLLFAFFFGSSLAAQCPPDVTLYFTSQSGIDNFLVQYPNCTELQNVFIQTNTSGTDPITNVNGFQNLTAVTGYFIISENPGSLIANLDGLESLTSVGTNLIIHGDNITDISALSNLQTVGGWIEMGESHVTSLAPLNNLTSLGGFEFQEADNALGDFDFVLNQNTLSGNLILSFTGNYDLSGLEGTTSIGGDFSIWGPITDLSPFSALQHVGGLVDIQTAAANVDAFSALTSVGGGLYVRGANLQNFNGFSNLTSLGGALGVQVCPLVQDMSGFEGLTSLGGPLGIFDMAGLQSLDGLQNINSIGGGITVAFTPLLQNLSGISNIDPLTIDGLNIFSNGSLSLCAYPNICSYIDSTNSNVNIHTNATGCATSLEVTEACETAGIDDIIRPAVVLYPNPVQSRLHIVADTSVRNISIYNNLGQQVYSLSSGEGIVSADLSHLANGVYSCHLTNSNGAVSVEKLIISK